jgi:hypothetical protein
MKRIRKNMNMQAAVSFLKTLAELKVPLQIILRKAATSYSNYNYYAIQV